MDKEKLQELKAEARPIARQAWIESKGDVAVANRLAKKAIRQRYGFIGTLTIIASVLQIMFLLFQFWKELNMSTPPEEPLAGEPSFDHLDG